MAADLPARHDRPDTPGLPPGKDLAARLSRLSAGHPSAPGCYADAGPRRPAETSPEIRRQERASDGAAASRQSRQVEQPLPAAKRAEWKEPLASGAVEQVGAGIVDQRASRFRPRERQVADFLAREGRAVVAVHDGYGREGRRPDAEVDGVSTEFKSLDPGASSTTVKAAITSAKGQASHAVIDGRESGLTQREASHGIRRFLGTPHADRMDSVRIIGDNYDLQWRRG